MRPAATSEKEILLGMGQPSVKTSVTIPRQLDARLRERAAKLAVPMSAIVTRALDVYLSSLEEEDREALQARLVSLPGDEVRRRLLARKGKVRT